jgi:hypothetical protein
VNQRYSPKPMGEQRPRFIAPPSTDLPQQQLAARPGSAGPQPQAQVPAPLGQEAAPLGQEAAPELELLWEGFRRRQRFEKLKALLSTLGIASIASGLVTGLTSLPQSSPVQACVNVAARYPTSFRFGLAVVALALLATGVVLLSDVARRFFL